MVAPDDVRSRLTRLRPDLLPVPYRIWFVLSVLVSLGVAAVILIPGLTDSVAAEGQGVIAQFFAPLLFRISVLTAAAVLAGASVVWVLLRERVSSRDTLRRDAVLREALVLTVALFPAFALMADGQLVRALIAVVPGVAVIVLAHVRSVQASHGGIATAGLVATIAWLTLLDYQATAAGASSNSWLWASLFGVAAAFAAFSSYYGVAVAAESRSSRLKFLYRGDMHPLIVLGIIVATAVLVGLRLTVARGLFPDPDPQLWSPLGKSPASWFIALLVAAPLVVVAVRASRRPLTRFGERRVVAALAALGNLELAISVVVIAVAMAVAAVTGAVFLPDAWIAFVPMLKFVGVVLLAVLVLLPMFRGTAARWIGLITALFLIPGTLSGVFETAGIELPSGLDGFPATPVQVLLLILAAAFGLAIWDLAVPESRIGSGLVGRLAVVPLVAVHAGWLLPAAWSGTGRVGVVIAVLFALFWLMPPVAADRTRHAYDVIRATTAQLLALVVFVLAIPSLFQDGALIVLGLLWLSIPIIAALTIDTIEPPEDSKVHSRPRARGLTEDT
jgi:hypothetical protein